MRLMRICVIERATEIENKLRTSWEQVVCTRIVCSLNQLGIRYSENVFSKSQRFVCYFMHICWSIIYELSPPSYSPCKSFHLSSLELFSLWFVCYWCVDALLLMCFVVHTFSVIVFSSSLFQFKMYQWRKKKQTNRKSTNSVKWFLGRNDVWEYRWGKQRTDSNIVAFIFSIALWSGHIVQFVYILQQPKKRNYLENTGNEAFRAFCHSHSDSDCDRVRVSL